MKFLTVLQIVAIKGVLAAKKTQAASEAVFVRYSKDYTNFLEFDLSRT